MGRKPSLQDESPVASLVRVNKDNLSFLLAQIFPLRRRSSCLDLSKRRVFFFVVGASGTKVRSIPSEFSCDLLLKRDEEVSLRYKGFDVGAQETPYRFGTLLISFLNVLGPV